MLSKAKKKNKKQAIVSFPFSDLAKKLYLISDQTFPWLWDTFEKSFEFLNEWQQWWTTNECRKTKIKPMNYQLDYPATLRAVVKPKSRQMLITSVPDSIENRSKISNSIQCAQTIPYFKPQRLKCITYFRQKDSNPMLFNAVHTLEACMKEYPTHTGKVEKLKTNILHLIGAKMYHKIFLHNAVPDLNESIEGSTDLKKKWHGSADCHTPIHLSLSSWVSSEFWNFQY